MCKELQDFMANRPYHVNQQDLIVDKTGNVVYNSRGAINYFVWFVNNFNEAELLKDENRLRQSRKKEQAVLFDKVNKNRMIDCKSNNPQP